MLLRQQTLLPEDIGHRLPTNTLSNTKRIHRWGNFIAGFSIEFVQQCLANLNPDLDSGLILDPFTGCGTTLIGAKNLGFATVGYELHPVFQAISSGKLQHSSSESIDQILDALNEKTTQFIWSEDAQKFLSKLFTDEDLTAISFAASNLAQLSHEIRDLSIVLFLKACELSCRAQTDGIYKAPTTTKTHISFQSALNQIAAEILDDIGSSWYQNHWLLTPQAQIIRSSAVDMTELQPESVGCCITSPPYLNNFDFGEMTRMQLYLLGWCRNWKEISQQIRNNLITNTTTALSGKKGSEYQNTARSSIPTILHPELDPIVQELARERSIRAGKKEYDYLVYPYYSQITQVLNGVFRALRPGATVHWVVADAALYGVHIETHEHTASIMREIGFRDVAIHLLRKRGERWVLSKRDGTPKGLGEYHIKAKK